ncbi:MAG: cytochrome c [Candidatus Competibacteraceae bacterium]|nr:cytochrome c [Candidatus Competibacteraceae bacterium]
MHSCKPKWQRLVGSGVAALSISGILTGLALAAPPQFGQPVSGQELAAWDISIGSSGEGLPPGSGSAVDGEAVYQAKCQSCHGEKGAGKPADPLVGGIGSIGSETTIKTVGSFWPYATTLFDYTRRAMPYDQPQSLSADELYAVSAYILWLNGIIDREQKMDAATLPQVQMPNRDGFISAWPPG